MSSEGIVPDGSDLDLWRDPAKLRIDRDLRKDSSNLTRRRVRWLVDTYYDHQNNRIRANAQMRACKEAKEPFEVVNWIAKSERQLENSVCASLGEFALTYRVGQWLRSIYGIGPVISAGLMAHCDITRPADPEHPENGERVMQETVGGWWRFAGLDPTVVWQPKTLRPWNTELKTLILGKMGQCFIRFKDRDECYYGHLYAQKKQALLVENEACKFREAAEEKMAKKPGLKGTPAWKYWAQGMLSPSHIVKRANRWTCKLFISHFHHVCYTDFTGKMPPAPFIFQHPELFGDHHHLLLPPNWPTDLTKIPEAFPGKCLTELVEGVKLKAKPLPKRDDEIGGEGEPETGEELDPLE